MGLAVAQTVQTWAKKNNDAGGNSTVYEYEKEGHGFMNAGKDIHEMMKSEPWHPSPPPPPPPAIVTACIASSILAIALLVLALHENGAWSHVMSNH